MNSPPLQALKIYIFGLPQRGRHLFAEKMGHISSTTWIPIPSVPLIILSAVPCESNASTIESTLAKIGSLANTWHSLSISYKEYVYLDFMNEILILVFALPRTKMTRRHWSVGRQHGGRNVFFIYLHRNSKGAPRQIRLVFASPSLKQLDIFP